jgi:hypothetical protein
VCGLVYERNPGDTWAFTIVGDRLPVAAGIALLYFGFGRSYKVLGVATFIVLGALMILTSPNRWARESRCTIFRACTGPTRQIRFRRATVRLKSPVISAPANAARLPRSGYSAFPFGVESAT